MKKVGIVGLGAIGRPLCQALDRGIPGVTLAEDMLLVSDPTDRCMAEPLIERRRLGDGQWARRFGREIRMHC